MLIEVDIRLTESHKTSTKVSKSLSKQKELVFEILVQSRPKLKFNRPKFEHFDLAHPNQDPTAKIHSERLDQKHLMQQQVYS